ncbi:MAG: Sua5/YciO/YrdC/YwlC family protein [Pseudomonadales bacterium]|nr:Sua5/YciO/YrdC/YwlC family protein [Pseudomonadales bacterium]
MQELKAAESRNQPGLWRIQYAASRLLAGGVIAYPTEGVWGLGCLPAFKASVDRILALKKRSWKQGLILVAGNIDQLTPYVEPLTDSDRSVLDRYWPGPTTFLLPRSKRVRNWVAGESDKIAFRIPDLDFIKLLCLQVASPIVSTSVNPSGKPPATKILRIRQYFPTGIDYIFPGQISDSGASEIRDFKSGEIIRHAAK